MRVRRGLLVMVVIALSAMALSGCIGEPETVTPPDAPVDAVVITDEETGEVRLVQPTRIVHGDMEPYFLEEIEDGTFSAGQQSDILGDYTWMVGMQPESAHIRDISDKVPTGVPVRITGEVNAPLDDGDLDFWFNAPWDEVWTSEWDTPRGGYSKVTYTMLYTGQEPIESVVWYDEFEYDPEFDYELKVTIETIPNHMVPGIPAIIPVPTDADSIEFRWMGAGSDVILYGPDDTYLGRFANTDSRYNLTLGPGTRGGDYVALIPQDGAVAGVTVYAAVDQDNDADGPRTDDYGTVLQDIQASDSGPVQANTPAKLEIEMDRVPLQVGLQVVIDEYSHGAAAKLSGPEGEFFSRSFKDTLPMVAPGDTGNIGFGGNTEVGASGLVAGTYIAEFTGDPHGDGEMWLWIVHYAR